MEEKTKKDIEEAENLFSTWNHACNRNYCRVFANTSEDVFGIRRKLKCSYEHLAVVLASGQQMCEFIDAGANDILAFDINSLSERQWDLLKNSYLLTGKESTENYFIYNSVEKTVFSEKHFQRIESFLEPENRIFWKYFYDHYDPVDIAKNMFFNMATNEDYGNDIRYSIHKDLSYLDDDKFPQFCKKLEKAKIKIRNVDIFQLPLQLSTSDPFDFMYLSNIFSYVNVSPLACLSFVRESLSPFLKEEGLIQCDYLPSYNELHYQASKKIEKIDPCFHWNHKGAMYDCATLFSDVTPVALSDYTEASTAIIYQKKK